MYGATVDRFFAGAGVYLTTAVIEACMSRDIPVLRYACADALPPLIRRFDGRIDNIDFPRPAKGSPAQIVFTCESSSRALTIKRTATRSHASCTERSATDLFYEHTATQREQSLFFGRSGEPAKMPNPLDYIKLLFR